jgi:predicted alpha/beta hydrolase
MATRTAAPEFHLARTADRWELALYRYPQASPSAPAVILASGYGCNRHFMDFDERYSLARYLARRGFDSWVVEFRGRGRSRPPPDCQRPNHWNFDDLVQHDVPAALRFVTQKLGHRRIGWVGHSMGGVVIYAYLGLRQEEPEPACAVTLGSPIRFPRMANQLSHTVGSFLLHLPVVDRIPQRLALGALWHTIGRTRALEVGMNPKNIDHRLVARALRRSLSNGSRAKLKQMSHWSSRGTFASEDGRIDYRANMCRVTTPFLIVAGADDRLATPEIASLAHDLLASPRKELLVLGEQNHFSADYGHVDLVFGRRAPDEVFPVIAKWMSTTLAAENES